MIHECFFVSFVSHAHYRQRVRRAAAIGIGCLRKTEQLDEFEVAGIADRWFSVEQQQTNATGVLVELGSITHSGT
jgi:hypothetical protein